LKILDFEEGTSRSDPFVNEYGNWHCARVIMAGTNVKKFN
jgi:hypothetical protein